MDKAISIFIDVFTKNPLTVTLAVLGVICVGLAIIGRIPPMDIRGIRAVILAVFGFMLIGVSIGLAWLLTASSTATAQPEPTSITVASPIAVTPTAASPTAVMPTVPQPTAQPIVTSVPPTQPPPTQPPPTQPLPTPTVLIVSATANNGVRFTAPVDGNYRFTIKEGVYCTMPNLCRSIIRGYFNREIVWGQWYNLPHPMEQEYELGCWEDRTASNRNCGVGSSAIVSMKAQQYMRWVIMEDKNGFSDNTGEVVLAIERLPY